MLRGDGYNLNLDFIFDRFQIDPPASNDEISIWNFDAITPDSFIWMIVFKNEVYYLYAEDFIESLQQVEKAIHTFTKSTTRLEFIKTKQVKEFEETSPVKSAQIYTQPENYNNVKLYASESGYDFVFLVKSDQKPDEAYYTEASS